MIERIPSPSFDAVHRWLNSPLGEVLLQQEARIVETAFDGIFGEQCLQLGLWGPPRTFLKYARTQRNASIADLDNVVDELPSALGKPSRLPVASDSIDVVILPHTLEFSDHPHAILREVQRVLRSDGSVVVLGFKPGGVWGLRRLLPGMGLPPSVETLISDRRLSDWLQLLDMRIQAQIRYFFRWPLPGRKRLSSPDQERRGQRWWPELAACYMLTAQKRLVALTPVRKSWRARPKVVGSLVEPTPRVIHVRFDKHH